MMHFAKPENALRRADELISVGRKEDALVALHDVLSSKRHRTWQPAIEAVILRFLSVCVEEKKEAVARVAAMEVAMAAAAMAAAEMAVAVMAAAARASRPPLIGDPQRIHSELRTRARLCWWRCRDAPMTG